MEETREMNEQIAALSDKVRAEAANLKHNRPEPQNLVACGQRLDAIADELFALAKGEAPAAAPAGDPT